jgi:hypothetical protein
MQLTIGKSTMIKCLEMDKMANYTEVTKLLAEFQLFEYETSPAEADDGIVRMKGIIQTANKVNANGRVYPRAILEREDTKFNELVRERRALGELDHPDSPIVQLENVSHVVTETQWDGDDLTGIIEVLDTPKGQILGKLVERGIKLGISSRGLGSTTKTNEGHDLVEDDFSLVTYDMVSNPSTSNAFMHLRESSQFKQLTEQTNLMKIDDIVSEILGL